MTSAHAQETASREAESRASASQKSRRLDFTKVDAGAQRFLEITELPGAALLVIHEGRVVHERYFGSYTEKTVVPIASASKWLAGAAIMALVDRQMLDLDAKVAHYLPEWAEQKDKAAITLRTLMNHTSGLPSEHPAKNDFRSTLRDAAREFATCALLSEPGKRFVYGGVSMQVAGAIAEVAAGKGWSELFAELVTDPLGLEKTRFGLAQILKNPQIGGGAFSTLREYGRFVLMLLQDGELDGKRVLSKEAVQALLADRTQDARVERTALGRLAGARGYGVGCWVDKKDAKGQTLQASSPGLFGFLPWIDKQRGVAGVWLIVDRSGARRQQRGELPDIRALVSEAIDAAAKDSR